MSSSNLTFKDLAPQQKKKLAKLIQKLKEVTDEKDKYQQLYQQSQQQIIILNQQLSKVKKDNEFMKSQLQTSIQAISIVKNSLSAEKIMKKHHQIQHNKSQEWQDIEDDKIQIHTKKRKIFEQHSAIIGQKYPLTTHKKANLYKSSLMGETQNISSKKKLQITNLKKQIKELTEQMKESKMRKIPMSQKVKQVEKIKKRFQKIEINDNIKKEKLNSKQSEDQQEFIPIKDTIKKHQLRKQQQNSKTQTIILPPSSNKKPNQINNQSQFKQNKNIPKSNQLIRGGFYDQPLFDLIDQLQKS